eukprot:TRINITY_DN8034_c0_g1_i1.p1 TRINITY_DN8034_c0_g1~~TRINITY_DN8034_c0_g1_i1.p1  ORF type:complete len:559 (-),score=84.98 TRINITY_DN8034_c0_g1_i1:254-1930(-)
MSAAASSIAQLCIAPPHPLCAAHSQKIFRQLDRSFPPYQSFSPSGVSSLCCSQIQSSVPVQFFRSGHEKAQYCRNFSGVAFAERERTATGKVDSGNSEPFVPVPESTANEAATPYANDGTSVSSALQRAAAYKQKSASTSDKASSDVRSAIERAKAYRLQKATGTPPSTNQPSAGTQHATLAGQPPPAPVPSEPQAQAQPVQPSIAEHVVPNGIVAPSLPAETATPSPGIVVEIMTRDGLITRTVSETLSQNDPKLKALDYTPKGISSMDFMGLNFADKRDSHDLPAGLSAPADLPLGPLPEVEILTRSAGQAGATVENDAASEGEASSGELYKPRVSTWGVFPRPRDISRAYGGGRTIQPGQTLESEDDKAARDLKTRQLLEEYRRLSGLDIDPKIQAECKEAMEAGQAFMDRGRLREALLEFESIVEKTVFKSEVHGSALLQKAVCLDSMARSEEARELYEKLQGHPAVGVRKKARQLLFGFQAAENLRVRGGYDYNGDLYRNYFDAFADGYNTMYKGSEEENDEQKLFWEALPYAALLLLPLIFVFFAAKLKGSV